MADDSTIWVDITSLKLWDKNPNEGDIGSIYSSIKAHGFNDTCHLWRGVVKAGNHSVMALTSLRADGWHPDKCDMSSKCLRVENGTWHISMIDISEMSEIRSDAFGVQINKTQRLGGWDEPALAELLQEVASSSEIALKSTGFDGDELDQLLQDLGMMGETQDNIIHAKLTDKFIVPPFTVLDARQGYWQERKRAWIGLGLKGELGRGVNIGAIPPNEETRLSPRYGKSDNGLLGFSEQAVIT